MKNYYQILGLSQDADTPEIKKAYRKLALKYHPDRNKGNAKAEKKFKEVAQAYQVLSSQKSRSQYDQKLSKGYSDNRGSRKSKTKTFNKSTRGFHPDQFQNMEKEFENFFGFNPKTKEKVKKDESGEAPMDTSNLFNSYFGFGNK